MTQAFGGLPTRNFQQGQFEEYENLNGNTIKETRMVANKACFRLHHRLRTRLSSRRCRRQVSGEHPSAQLAHRRRRARIRERLGIGTNTGVGDLDAVLKANWLCNDLGMDPISMGAALAAAMELYRAASFALRMWKCR